MAAIGDLDGMLSGLHPRLRDGGYVFVSVPTVPAGVAPVMTFTEDEGLTLVVPSEQAAAAGLPHDLVMAWITLGVHSALDGVGLTAAVSTALARAGISCNAVAAAYHDHLFVPRDDAARALAVLEHLSEASGQPGRGHGHHTG